MGEKRWTASVTDKAQSDGDQTIDVTDFPVGYRHLSNWQGHFEINLASDGSAHTPTAGTATIYGVPKGGAVENKISLAVVDLTSTAALALFETWSGIFDSIIVSPDSLDADCEYNFIVTAW